MEKNMIITFTHYKGGTGKTTSCINVAGYLAKMGKKVLVIDLDPQGNLTSGLGVSKETIEKSTHHMMDKGSDIKKIILETDFPGLHLAPATQDLVKTNKNSFRSITQARILERSIRKIKDEYDFVLIDTPPVHSHFIVNGLVAADKIIIVLDPGIFAIEGIESLRETFNKFFKNVGIESKIAGALITKCQTSWVPWKKNYTKEVKQTVEGLLAKKAFTIPYSDDIFESHRVGKPLSHFKPNSSVGKAYNKIAEMVLLERRKTRGNYEDNENKKFSSLHLEGRGSR
jgi:chromosome partitioning protein